MLAGLGGLDADDLGLARDTWTRGVRWGLGAVGLLSSLVYALALALGPVRDSLDQPDDPTIAHVLLTALLVIPLATVIPEELAFRGLLWGRLRRDHGTRIATDRVVRALRPVARAAGARRSGRPTRRSWTWSATAS